MAGPGGAGDNLENAAPLGVQMLMAAINHARLKELFLELVQIDSLSRRERDVALRLVRELEGAGLTCRFDSTAVSRPLFDLEFRSLSSGYFAMQSSPSEPT